MTNLEILNDDHLSDDEEDEPADDNDEVPPQVVHIQRVPGLDVVRSLNGTRPGLRAVKGARLVGPNYIGVLVHSGAVARNNEGTLAR